MKKYKHVKNAKHLIQHILDVCEENGMSPHEFIFVPPVEVEFNISNLNGYHSEIIITNKNIF